MLLHSRSKGTQSINHADGISFHVEDEDGSVAIRGEVVEDSLYTDRLRPFRHDFRRDAAGGLKTQHARST